MSNREPDVPRKIGVIGLGVGALAAYGRGGDELLFYELDPSVIRIAGEGGLFSYLSDSEADIEIIAGDARLSLEEALATTGSEQFDVLVVDAFSGDSIPVHLLTHEAFLLYKAHLAPGGLLIIHVSNRRLELTPLAIRLGDSVGLEGYEVVNASLRARLSSKSRWVVLAEDPSALQELRDFAARWVEEHRLGPKTIWINRMAPRALETAPFWTDDYSDLFSVLK
jgi:spermidine synthase